MNTRYMKGTSAFAKIFEVVLFAVSVACLAVSVLAFLNEAYTIELIKKGFETGVISLTGFAVKAGTVVNQNNAYLIGAFAALCGFVSALSGAIIFRNVHLILKTSLADQTPFTQANAKRTAWIGRLLIIQPILVCVVTLLASFFCNITVTLNISLLTIFCGFVVICFSQFIAYGTTLK